MEQAFRRALQGSYRHFELILAYAEGRPRQALDIKEEPRPMTEVEAEEIIKQYLGRQALDSESNESKLTQQNQAIEAARPIFLRARPQEKARYSSIGRRPESCTRHTLRPTQTYACRRLAQGRYVRRRASRGVVPFSPIAPANPSPH